ncbi:hypothetical protein [Bauldia litoralis]|uniref:Uncharacterized protein n=1 Tax=Bauldia litoralis TaxID=665467 RepID=A0A1G6CWF4_9HYPH|nr:hypothetical protein [Bauldia litoralis]SDB37247.1 hypothetical protein SAMN02982931_02845 [Bauldia litoralis]
MVSVSKAGYNEQYEREKLALLAAIKEGPWHQRPLGIIVISSTVAVVAGTLANIIGTLVLRALGWQ